MSLIQPGFAIRRNGSCPAGLEVDCGGTEPPFHACCPSSFTCPGPQYNVVCCPSDAIDCNHTTLTNVPQPTCANSTWDMFDNNGLFCCEHGLSGYNKSNLDTYSDGCGIPDVSLSVSVSMLSTVAVGVDPKTVVSSERSSTSIALSSLSSASASPSTVPTPSPSPLAQYSPSTSVGAIAGAVIGSIAALLLVMILTWYLMRLRRRQGVTGFSGETRDRPEQSGKDIYRVEAGGQDIHEANEHGSKPDVELPAMPHPVELDGTGGFRRDGI
ncbi:hypothetical protein HBH70_007550 [Parastagonospora nodorum]|nr:hypothetical protein HBH53_076190 [Parastagonospora nodorum]KAH3987810.1 hypothetical protein HBH52_038140 [Parastagonospora nodorum]KAH4128154.1 hypothetical protein HBH47_038310 [Parastagonospora nodorum]KAH4200214.1 hypothetical protein HBH42_041190 [Parastagonospora nodorum]KAH4859901.1 hypothetical protein HBH75_045740 [Parastagonospora nodorum]